MGAGELSTTAVACTAEPTVLGEGARWDARRGELLRVDILAGSVFRDRVDDKGALHAVREYRLPTTVGAIAPIRGDDGWLLAAGRGFVHLQPDGTHRSILDVALEGTRMNDAACDPGGRLWAGSMADDHRPFGGALHRLDASGLVATMLDGLTIPNGIGWSPDGETLYLVDSGPRVILEYAFDAHRGTISAGHILITLPESLGTPDGLTVDAGGDLWVAVYGGGCVQHYAPDGRLRGQVPVPARQTTSCAFAGQALGWLFVTTATEGWTNEQRRADPAAGLVYRLGTAATGVPAAPFVPDPAWWRTVVAPDA